MAFGRMDGNDTAGSFDHMAKSDSGMASIWFLLKEKHWE